MAGRKPRRRGGTEIEILQRKNRAVELHSQGLTLRQIADEMGVHYTAVYYYLNDILNKLEIKHASDIEHWRGVQLERLEVFADAVQEALAHPQGDSEDEKQERRLQAVQTGLKVMERTARLLGLDMPTKIESQTKDVLFVMDLGSTPNDPTND